MSKFQNHDLSSTFEALKLLHLDSAFYRNPAGLKLVRQICLFLAENEADTKRLMTIRYIYAIKYDFMLILKIKFR